MRPDFSVLFLTTLIGVGQGLFLALFTVQLYALFGLLPPQDGHLFYAHGSLLALVFLVAGLVASFFHLGRPERAWRSAAMWRTSWLSREVIVLPALMGTVFLYGAAHLVGWKPVLVTLPSGIAIDATVLLGVLGTLLAFALFLCTAMIYACLPFLREWASPLTVINFTLLGGASGFTLAAPSRAGSRRTSCASSQAGHSSSPCSALRAASPRSSGIRACGPNRRCRPPSGSSIRASHRSRWDSWADRSIRASSSIASRDRMLHRVKWMFLLAAFAIPLGAAGRLLVGCAAAIASPGVRRSISRTCWPSAGSFSRRRTIRRISITRPWHEVNADQVFFARSAYGYKFSIE